MIDGDPKDFIETAYGGSDIIFIYKGIKYWFQGYTHHITKVNHMEIWQYEPISEDGIVHYLWEYDADSMEECLEHLQTDPIFDGKTFWEVEQEIEWVDD